MVECTAIGELPAAARKLLQKAAETKVTDADPNARIKAIDRAATLIKARYPEYFKP